MAAQSLLQGVCILRILRRISLIMGVSEQQAWILWNVNKDVNKALDVMSHLFHMKSNSRTFIAFWKPTLERFEFLRNNLNN